MSRNSDRITRQMRANRRALRRLRDLYPDKYNEFYIEEALAEGVMPREERERILAGYHNTDTVPA